MPNLKLFIISIYGHQYHNIANNTTIKVNHWSSNKPYNVSPTEAIYAAYFISSPKPNDCNVLAVYWTKISVEVSNQLCIICHLYLNTTCINYVSTLTNTWNLSIPGVVCLYKLWLVVNACINYLVTCLFSAVGAIVMCDGLQLECISPHTL